MTLDFLLGLEAAVLTFFFVPTIIAFWEGAPWVPTPMGRVKKMLELAKIKPGERVYDLGCGDGRLVQLASKLYRADAVGIELSPLIYAWGRLRNFLWVRSKARMLMRDFRRLNISDANVVFFYLLPHTLRKMRPYFEKTFKKGTRIVSYAFQVDGWEPVYVEPKVPEKNYSRILVYEIGRT